MLGSARRKTPGQQRGVAVNAEAGALEIACSQCGKQNRVPLDKLGAGPVCGQCKAALAVDAPIVLDDRSFPVLVGKSALPVLVDFWAPWCGPCRFVAPEMEKIARDKAGKMLVGKLNTDENPITSRDYRIQSIPTMLYFKKGRAVKQLVGAQPAAAILKQLGG